jgi:hypothetical protein
MQRLKGQSQRQLTFDLKREGMEPLVARRSEATLLQALAALLLGALGEVEQRESAGGVDELEDHN